MDTTAFYEATQSVRDKYGKDHQDLMTRIKEVQ
jgi:hypothetical protein